ncbi:BTAD domain-containing putative transcriptional regulator [Micromonospora sonneratiae]|uniref:AAA family ATPase n=1 Tax=Micromonospora sonneratiae TaxID=1184706 RepID=A0ABW3Y9U3_9ACTN
MAIPVGGGPLVGRDAELSILGAMVTAVSTGRGGTAWIEGEPGIGKSALLHQMLAQAQTTGCRVLQAVGDELDQRLPLRALVDALGTEADAEVGSLLRSGGAGGPTGSGDPVPAAVERLLTLIDGYCAQTPLVLAFDDLQWADEASLLIWQRLGRAVDQIPLLLISAYRPVPASPTILRLRQTAEKRGATVVSLGPLEAAAVTGLVTRLAGAEPGPGLRRIAQQAGGNPLYARELVDTLVREHRITVGAGIAEIVDDDRAPVSLAGAIADRLHFLSPETNDALRMAALLGADFSVLDLATVTDTPATRLLPVLDEAIAAGVLAEEGNRLRFRHGLIRQALHDATPASTRAAMHRQAARALAEAGVPVDRIAAHLLVTPEALDGWVLDWLAEHASDLAYRAPEVAADLLRAGADRTSGDSRQAAILRGLSTALFLLSRLDEAEQTIRRSLARARGGPLIADLAWDLSQVLTQGSRHAEALAVLDETLSRTDLPTLRQVRLRARRSRVLTDLGRYDEGEREARAALGEGERLDDRVAVGHALHTLYLLADYEPGLELIERGLAVIGDDPELFDTRLALLVNRCVSLDALGRTEAAMASLHEALRLAERFGTRRLTNLYIFAASSQLDHGAWDEAYAGFTSLSGPIREDRMLQVTGGLAIIAAHRDDRAATAEHLRAGAQLGRHTGHLATTASYLNMARAIDAEQRGRPDEAAVVLAHTVDEERAREFYDRYVWLAELVRLALAADDLELARAAVAAAEADAAQEPLPLRVLTARRARATLDGDAAALLAIATDYRARGMPLELGQCTEEAAVLLARSGDVPAARAALTDAVRAYVDLGAAWDIRRADTRLRPYGVRRGPRSIRRRPSTGWDALTPTEERVARMVAQSRSNPDIAAELFLSRRTVQTHVSNILAKLGVASRIEIARMVVDRSVAQPDGARPDDRAASRP